MPSQQDIPSTAQILAAARAEIAAIERPAADLHSGSFDDIQCGVGAILFHRQAIQDRDNFRAVYFDTASGLDADALIRGRYGVLAARIPDLPGTGAASLARAAAAAGGGTFRKGTRLSVLPNEKGGPSQSFEVSSDTTIGASALTAIVPIRSIALANAPVSATRSTNVLTIDDPTWDDSWVVTTLDCGAGTLKEDDPTYKARIKATRLAQRKGYAKSISDACKSVGAAEVALFPSDWSGVDTGINHCFVADASFVTTPSLLHDCRVVVDSWRVLGADLFVFGMTATPLALRVAVQVWNVEQVRSSDDISTRAIAAAVDFFAGSTSQFYWTKTAIESAIMRQLRGDAQSVTVSAFDLPGNPVSEPNRSTMLDTASLPRYSLGAGDVSVTVTGPN